MIYNEQILTDQRLIVITIEGDMDIVVMDELGLTYRKKALDLGYRLICDICKANNKISLIDAFRASKKYRKPIYKELKSVPVAIVALGGEYIFFKVIEQFMTNENSNIKVFNRLEAAIGWFELQPA